MVYHDLTFFNNALQYLKSLFPQSIEQWQASLIVAESPFPFDLEECNYHDVLLMCMDMPPHDIAFVMTCALDGATDYVHHDLQIVFTIQERELPSFKVSELLVAASALYEVMKSGSLNESAMLEQTAESGLQLLEQHHPGFSHWCYEWVVMYIGSEPDTRPRSSFYDDFFLEDDELEEW